MKPFQNPMIKVIKIVASINMSIGLLASKKLIYQLTWNDGKYLTHTARRLDRSNKINQKI
jgi:glutamine cyclotransferase